MKKDVLRQSPHESFRQLARSAKVAKMMDLQVGLNTYGLSNQANNIFDITSAMGFRSLRPRNMLIGMSRYMKSKGIEFPSGKKLKQERGVVASQVLDIFQLSNDDDGTQDAVSVDIDGNKVCLTEYISNRDFPEGDSNSNIGDSMVIGQLVSKVNRFTSTGQGRLAVEMDSPTQINIKGPRFTVQGEEGRACARKQSDKVITIKPDMDVKDMQSVKFGLLKETYTHCSYEHQRGAIKQALDRGEILSSSKFTLEDWPKDPLMTHLRHSVDGILENYERDSNYFGDPKDLKYQVLFRLTTFDPSDIFHDGIELEQYMRETGAYTNWRNILRLDSEYIDRFEVNKNLILAIAEEQSLIINDRLNGSRLPLDEILHPRGMFSEPNWVIQKRNGNIYAVQEESVTANRSAIPLTFDELDPNYANQFHRDLHYIHTPRSDLAFGLFVAGDKVPFSVVALGKVDRNYKANTLLFQGYDPRKSYDLTRLHSRPGTPGNTSSSIFALTFNHLRTHYPETQVVLSSFMPSYATGISMTSGGFDNPVLVKPLVHTFGSRVIDGRQVYEHLTKRRLENYSGNRICSRLPLLPTVELISQLQPPRFSPLPGADKLMLELC